MSRLNRITSDDRLLVIAPHPDDEALGAGGIIQRAREAHAAVRVLFLTDGDNNPWPQRAIERRWTIGPQHRAAWGARRRQEALRSIDTLGLSRDDVFFCGLPDQGLTAKLLNDQPVLPRLLQTQLSEFAPTLVIGPSIDDHHPDHSAASVRLRIMLAELPSPPRLFEYMIHGKVPDGAEGYTAVPLSPQHVASKRAAVQCHRSQTTFAERRMMACVNDHEWFRDVAAAETESQSHLSFVETGTHWTLAMSHRRWFDRFSQATLEVLVVHHASVVMTLRARLATRWGRVAQPELFDRRSGKMVVRGFYDSAGRLVLPAPRHLRGDQLFIKRSGGIAFFDESGWTPIARKKHESVELKVEAPHPFERPTFAATAAGTH